MRALYKKVVKGVVERIPHTYSKELWNVTRALLSVNPKVRPDCFTIMSDSVFMKYEEKLFPETFFYNPSVEEKFENQSYLLRSIYVP